MRAEVAIAPLGLLPFGARSLRFSRRGDESVRVRAAVPYGALEAQTVDVYAPRSPQHCQPQGRRRAVLFVHGGSWAQGAPWQYSLLARQLLRRHAAAAADEEEELAIALMRYRVFPTGDIDEVRSTGEVRAPPCRRGRRRRGVDAPRRRQSGSFSPPIDALGVGARPPRAKPTRLPAARRTKLDQ